MDSKLEQIFYSKITVLSETVWEKTNKDIVERWLSNFTEERERIHALYLLTMFMYFRNEEMRVLLMALFRDKFRHPIIQEIRTKHNNTIEAKIIEPKFREELYKTKFLGLGNPSESGPYLLYYFRQVNELPKSLFIHEHEILKFDERKENRLLRFDAVKRYIFIDDFAASGTQAIRYSKNGSIDSIKEKNPEIKIEYIALFATTDALNDIRKKCSFDKVECVIELDDSYKCFSENSRIKKNLPEGIDIDYAEKMCRKYGEKLMEVICEAEGFRGHDIKICSQKHALGFKNGQYLLGFNHNTPDNTLPIFWFSEKQFPWVSIFRRYNKVYK
jgi:hypothetical protein